jgi:aryl-alcohol dehydrogenase
MQITAAVTRAPHAPQSIESLELSPPRADEILVRIVATGICHTDIAMRDQLFPVPQPVVLGHEGAGVVVEVGAEVEGVVPGDHVVLTYNSCGTCESCVEAAPTYCHEFQKRNFAGLRADGTSPLSKDGAVIHGHFFGQSSFATHAICNRRNVVRVPRDLPLETLGALGCGLQTGAGAVANALALKPGKSIAVFGVGSVGLAGVMAANALGASVIVAVDRHQSRLDAAADLGATHTLLASPDLVADLKRIRPSGLHYALDTTGVPAVIRQAVDALAPRGHCGMVGAAGGSTEIVLRAHHMLSGGRHLRGIVEGDADPQTFIPWMIDLHRQGRFPFHRMLRFYDLADISQAMDDLDSGAAIKPVVRMP